MTSTRLEIASPILHAAVHRVYARIPARDRARLGTLMLITDAWHPDTRSSKAWGLCQPYEDGHRVIFLSPELVNRTWGQIENTIAHELAHACQEKFHGPDVDEAFAIAQASRWGFDPEDKIPRIDWKR